MCGMPRCVALPPMSCQAESSSADSGLNKAAIRMLFSWLTEKRVLAHESERAKTRAICADRRQNADICRRCLYLSSCPLFMGSLMLSRRFAPGYLA